MIEMPRRSAFALLSVVLMTVLAASPPARADIAPYDVQGGGAAGVLCNQTEMRMLSFSVDVTVNLPDVHEVFSYLLVNPTARALNQTVIIPITFDNSSGSDLDLESAEISVNGVGIGYTRGNITLEPDLVIDSPAIIGLYANLTFPPGSTTNITLDMSRTFRSHTRSFVYIYSAKTARYWNGTIAHGHFGLTYQSELEEMICSMPNASRRERAVTSEMYDWDGNAIYNVTVKTGIVYRPSHPSPPFEYLLLLLVFVLVMVAAVIAVVLVLKRKKAAK